MKTLKKTIAAFLCVLSVGLLSTTAFAESMNTDMPTTIPVNGVVQTVDIAATFTIAPDFIINPAAEQGSQFTSPTLTFTNDCNAPLDVTALKMSALNVFGEPENDSPHVSAPDKFEDWSKLGKEETLKYISFALIHPSGEGDGQATTWFADEDEEAPFLIGTLEPNGSFDTTFDAKFGLAWEQERELHYNLVTMIALAE